MAVLDVRHRKDAEAPLDVTPDRPSLPDMSVLELKQRISRLSPRQRKEIQIYLLRLKRDTPAWKRATAKRIRDMQAGKQVWIEELEARMRRS